MKKNYTTEHYGKNRQEWLAHRGYGGSSVSALLGVNPYMDKLDIYCSSVNPAPKKESADSVAIQYGRNAEPILAKIFAINYPKYKVIYPKDITMCRRIDKPYMTYTPDALLKEIETSRNGFLEIKTHIIQSKEDYDMWANNQLPQNYYCQVLQGFAVMNDKDFCELFAILNFLNYDTGEIDHSELRHYHLERKDREVDIEYIETVQTNFEENHIKTHTPPDIEISL